MAREKLKRGRPRLTADEVKNYRYTFRIDKELEEKLDSYRKKTSFTNTVIFRKALEYFLDDNL